MTDEQRSDGRASRRPVRTCVGCAREDVVEALVRVIAGPDVPGEASGVAVDTAGRAGGRGAHVHPARSCLERACRGGFSRSFRRAIAARPDDVAAQIVASSERRIDGLLLAARRAGALALGADAATEALAGGAPLVVVAVDAASAASLPAVRAAIGEGRAVAFRDREALGRLFGRDAVAVLAVRSAPIAAEVKRVRAMAERVSG